MEGFMKLEDGYYIVRLENGNPVFTYQLITENEYINCPTPVNEIDNRFTKLIEPSLKEELIYKFYLVVKGEN